MAEDKTALPKTQVAVQLTGPGRLVLNRAKEVARPGPHQVLVRVEAVGLCFSDMKLLEQFSAHPRKTKVLAGLPQEVLDEIPSYVPGDLPTVPGHEAVCRIVAVGDRVRRHSVGRRVLVQTDYRALATDGSNAAFGYNFEGALQQYVLTDERVLMDPSSCESFLIPVDDEASASEIALVEPWACVEDSYVSPQRRRPLPCSTALVVVDDRMRATGIAQALLPCGEGGSVTTVGCTEEVLAEIKKTAARVLTVGDIASLPDGAFDDIIYTGARAEVIEALSLKLAAAGIMNIVTCGRRIGATVKLPVGRAHYGGARWVGTHSDDCGEGYRAIPETGELRPGDRVLIAGAAGPMGQMHLLRALSSGISGLEITASDLDDSRLKALEAKARSVTGTPPANVRFVNPSREDPGGGFTYVALMAPAAALVADAIGRSAPGCLINVFAGIPPTVLQAVDLDTYLANDCYIFGTSGSVVRDMKIVLEKLFSGRLDTNASVDAVSGMAGAIEALAAVKERRFAGKVIVYPCLAEVGLIELSKMEGEYPSVAAMLEDGRWCKRAEDELLAVAG